MKTGPVGLTRRAYLDYLDLRGVFGLVIKCSPLPMCSLIRRPLGDNPRDAVRLHLQDRYIFRILGKEG